MAKQTPITKPETDLDMYNLANTYNDMRWSKRKAALSDMLDEMACPHGYIVVENAFYRHDGQKLIRNYHMDMCEDCKREQEAEQAEEGRRIAEIAQEGDTIHYLVHGKLTEGRYARHDGDRGVLVFTPEGNLIGVSFKNIMNCTRPFVEETASEPEPGEIVSTPKTPKSFIIREEVGPGNRPVWRVYRDDNTPLYIGRDSVDEAAKALRATGELVRDVTFVSPGYKLKVTFQTDGKPDTDDNAEATPEPEQPPTVTPEQATAYGRSVVASADTSCVIEYIDNIGDKASGYYVKHEDFGIVVEARETGRRVPVLFADIISMNPAPPLPTPEVAPEPTDFDPEEEDYKAAQRELAEHEGDPLNTPLAVMIQPLTLTRLHRYLEWAGGDMTLDKFVNDALKDVLYGLGE